MKNFILKIKIKVALIIDTITYYINYAIYYYKCNPKVNVNKVDKVLFIAHPDDELLFFYKSLINNPGWLVICMTNGSNKTRMKEFISISGYLNVSYKIWNFKDGNNVTWNKEKVYKKIKNILKLKKNWNIVATHNYEGEYGHLQHKQLNSSVRCAYNGENFYTSIPNYLLKDEQNRLSDNESKHKEMIMYKYYKSQYFVLEDLMSYLEYEGLIKWNDHIKIVN